MSQEVTPNRPQMVIVSTEERKLQLSQQLRQTKGVCKYEYLTLYELAQKIVDYAGNDNASISSVKEFQQLVHILLMNDQIDIKDLFQSISFSQLVEKFKEWEMDGITIENLTAWNINDTESQRLINFYVLWLEEKKRRSWQSNGDVYQNAIRVIQKKVPNWMERIKVEAPTVLQPKIVRDFYSYISQFQKIQKDSLQNLRQIADRFQQSDEETLSDLAPCKLLIGAGIEGEIRSIAHEILKQGQYLTKKTIALTGFQFWSYYPTLLRIFSDYQLYPNIHWKKTVSPNQKILKALLQLPLEGFEFNVLSEILKSPRLRLKIRNNLVSSKELVHAEKVLRDLGYYHDKKELLESIQQIKQRIPKDILWYFIELFQDLEEDRRLQDWHDWALTLFEASLDSAAVQDFSLITTQFPKINTPISYAEYVFLIHNAMQYFQMEVPIYHQSNLWLVPPEIASTLEYDHLYIFGMRDSHRLVTNRTSSQVIQRCQTILEKQQLAGHSRLSREEEYFVFIKLLMQAKSTITLTRPGYTNSGDQILPHLIWNQCINHLPIAYADVDKPKMLLKLMLERDPFSYSQKRIQAIRNPDSLETKKSPFNPGQSQLLASLPAMIRQRQFQSDFSPYDGNLEISRVNPNLAQQFKFDQAYRVTSFEQYQDCPFRFFVTDVLKIKKLALPANRLEARDIGEILHSAVEFFHREVRTFDEEMVDTNPLIKFIQDSVQKQIQKKPSKLLKKISQIEGKRLERLCQSYISQWMNFRGDIQKYYNTSRPSIYDVEYAFGKSDETSFTMKHEDKQLSLSGRIDRIDIAQSSKNQYVIIIDYKTGKQQRYKWKDIANLQRIQLPLYALAIQQEIKDSKTLPILGYWELLDKGWNSCFPTMEEKAPSTHEKRWHTVSKLLKQGIFEIFERIQNGQFHLAPYSEDSCRYCDVKTSCRIVQVRGAKTRIPLKIVDAISKEK